MKVTGAIIQAARKLIPHEAQDELIMQLENADTIEASPVGAILIGMYILKYVGFSRYVDELLGEEHTTIEQLKNHYRNRAPFEKPMISSTGFILKPDGG